MTWRDNDETIYGIWDGGDSKKNIVNKDQKFLHNFWSLKDVNSIGLQLIYIYLYISIYIIYICDYSYSVIVGCREVWNLTQELIPFGPLHIFAPLCPSETAIQVVRCNWPIQISWALTNLYLAISIFEGVCGHGECIPLPIFNMEPENDGFPKGIFFRRGWFLGSMLNFKGVFGSLSCKSKDYLERWWIFCCISRMVRSALDEQI